MIIDNQINGLTCDITGNFLDIYFDENNNSFSNIDNRTTTSNNNTSNMSFNLPESTFSFKNMLKLTSVVDENAMDLNLKLNKQLTKQSVKRALFVEKDEIDHEANLKLVRKQMELIEKQESEKWSFDFKNNRPLKGLNSRYEWFIVEQPVLNKLDLNKSSFQQATTAHSIINKKHTTNCNTKISNNNSNLKLNNISNCDKKNESLIASCSTTSTTQSNVQTATRSVKRKLNINDYFQPTKKRTSCISSKDQSNDAELTSVNLSNLKKSNEIKGTNVNKYESSTNKQIIIKQSLKRKCKKSRISSTQQQRRQPKKSKSLEKVSKRQTTLKF